MLPDKNKQKQIWQRVYGSLPKPRPQPRRALQACRARAAESLRLYKAMAGDPIYGPAYEKLARLCREELAMLERLL